MEYLLDSNIFIEAKRRYYGMDICPGFWHWLDVAQDRGRVASIKPVFKELTDGNDELADWAKHRDGTSWFLPVEDEATQRYFTDIVRYVSTQDYTGAAIEEFLSVADPWLIAKAGVLDAVVVTHEVYNEHARRRVLIPNICQHFRIRYLDTFDLLRVDSAAFVMPSV